MASKMAKTGLKIPEIKIPDLMKSDSRPAESHPPQPEQMELITTIIERGSGNRLMKLYTDNHVFTHIRSEGIGTATSEILDILGLGSSEKDIIFSLTSTPAARGLLDRLDDELRGAVPGRGIAFTMPLTAVNSLLAALVTRSTKKEKEHDMDKEQKSCLILALVNQGYTDVVMDTAKKAGARGGTVIRGRWVGEVQAPQLQGLYSQSEKDILWIVVPKEIRNQVMDSINSSHGVRTKAGALVCSLGIDRLVHLG